MSLRLTLTIAAVALVAALGGAWWWLRPPGVPPLPADDAPDPRLAYAGPFLNVHPGVKYVGTATCAECHPTIADVYAKHPMGRSAVPIDALAAKQPYDEKHRNPFDSQGSRFRVERDGGRVFHVNGPIDDGRPLYEIRHEVKHAIGSGTRGYSYLAEEDGLVYQTPVSWFSGKDIWDQSPGFSRDQFSGRPINASCLHCHVNNTSPVAGSTNRFDKPVIDGHAIGCERCHGPGGKHAADREANVAYEKFDPSIVNPKHLKASLRDNICEQCHVSGEDRHTRRGRDWYDFRPGMPISDFLSIHVRNPDMPGVHKSVGHVEQMRMSACYTKSADPKKMTCVSCHDPHRKPDADKAVAHYRARCLTCHTEASCREPVEVRKKKQPDDSCFACHMPKGASADIAHTALTDHRVRRRPAEDAPALRALGPDDPPVVNLHRDELDVRDPQTQRDAGIALTRLLFRNKLPPGMAEQVPARAGSMLAVALAQHPGDVPALVARGDLYWHERRFPEALAEFGKARARAGDTEEVLDRVAVTYRAMKKADEAIDAYRRNLKNNPRSLPTREGLAALLMEKGDHPGAIEHARELVRLDPGGVEGRRQLVTCLAKTGDVAGAEREFAVLRKLRPGADTDRWFEGAKRGR